MKQITIHENKVQKILGDNFGLFFEDLNHAADGGLYAELVQNRSFEYCTMDNEGYHGLTAWEKSPALQWEVRSENPLNKKMSIICMWKAESTTGSQIAVTTVEFMWSREKDMIFPSGQNA